MKELELIEYIEHTASDILKKEFNTTENAYINIEEIKKQQGSEEQRAYYLLLSFVFCCIQPRDYTVYNRRKDCIGNDISKLLMELHYIAILQGIL